MDVHTNESHKLFRGRFFSTLNKSFRLASAKSRIVNSSPIDNESSLVENMSDLGLNSTNESSTALRPLEIIAPRIDTYRFSMANLEETQDADLDAILGELCALDSEYDEEISRVSSDYSTAHKNGNEINRSCGQQQESKDCTDGSSSITRADSPDNDSAFSDTVSMLSSESSASSSASSKCKALKLNLHANQKDASFQQKADKIKLALERMREANIKKLFIKAFSMDGSSKSLLVDEKMSCGYVARLLADKNHLPMEPKWAVVEHLPDLHMERVYEDHEMLVDNLMLWTRESKNKIIFAERPDKIALFQTPEKFILTEDDRGWSSEHDEHSRQVIIEEFFGQSGGGPVSGHPVPPMEGPLYLKTEGRKGWKQYYFVLRPSGLYYSPKEKAKTLKELTCLATFDTSEVYRGINWKKKYKSPTDHCFAIKHPRLQQPKSVKFIKFLCADDQHTLDRWVTAMRIAKHGRQLYENYRSLVEELTQEDLDHLAHARSCSITSLPSKAGGGGAAAAGSPAQCPSSAASVANSDISSGRHSRASSSSSSGCLSDAGAASETAFDCEFPMGTIKRKPSLKPNIPLTWMTRQLKEMAEKEAAESEEEAGDGGTLTRRRRRDDTLTRASAAAATADITDSGLYSSPSNSLINTSGSPVHTVGSATPSYGHYEAVSREGAGRGWSDAGSALYGYATIYEKLPRAGAGPGAGAVAGADDLPLPPPPEDVPEHMFSSTLSLDSLPPPPPPEPLEDVAGSQLSLPPPPADLPALPAPPTPPPRRPSLDSLSSGASRTSSLHSDKSLYGHQTAAYGACLAELQNKKLSNGSPSLQKKILIDGTKERTNSIKKVIFADDLPGEADVKKNKRITFNLSIETSPASPHKPPPPKRNESTRLTSPKKLVDSSSNPPKEFLKDLQKVMRKKWQVAQKCKLEPATTPHEVLGFREYPLSEDYKETSVSMWVQEHYGCGLLADPLYENAAGAGTAGGATTAREPPPPARRRPPPAPPRRADSTHLSSLHAHAPAPAPAPAPSLQPL